MPIHTENIALSPFHGAVDGFFPAPLADERLQQATQAWLDAHPEAPAALRRLVSEHLAGVERALNAQRADQEV